MPRPSTKRPEKRPFSTPATPYITAPMHSTMKASLPMLDGQNSIVGKKKTSHRYRRSSASGNPMRTAR